MTELEQRIAIANVCGFTQIGWRGERLEGIKEESIMEVPDYLNDLNAMHDAENTLSEYDKINIYDGELLCVCQNHFGNTIRATCKQRADAFIATLGYLSSKRSQAV